MPAAMTRKYVAFDIETAKILPQHVSDLKEHRPLGVACAATLAGEEPEPRLWHAPFREDASPGPMNREQLAELVRFLETAVEQGATILTWNGVGFDFDILAEESGMIDECRRLARAHVDMMFHAFCELGYPIALDSAAQAMRLPGKSAEVAQWMAPKLWAEGETQKVLEYVAQDARATLQLALACEKQRSLHWTARSGRRRSMPLAAGWLTVDAALRLPPPDTSWMSSPLSRTRFTGWLKRRRGRK